MDGHPLTDVDGCTLSPAQMADACGVPLDTLRYYEREGLLSGVERTPGGQRRYQPEDVAWVAVLRCLRVTALPIREMRRFAELVRAGDAGIAESVALPTRHREDVLRRITELQDALVVIDHKLAAYGAPVTGAPTVDTAGVSTMPTLDGQGARASCPSRSCMISHKA
jgi:DNA-binding transcriptional MerR regulator